MRNTNRRWLLLVGIAILAFAFMRGALRPFAFYEMLPTQAETIVDNAVDMRTDDDYAPSHSLHDYDNEQRANESADHHDRCGRHHHRLMKLFGLLKLVLIILGVMFLVKMLRRGRRRRRRERRRRRRGRRYPRWTNDEDEMRHDHDTHDDVDE